jgi:SAM-dependent methyltransferase
MKSAPQDRLDREKEFFNEVFQERSRQHVTSFYAITRFSHQYYIDRLVQRVVPNVQVLEYGCGPGSYAFLLAEQGAQVSGIDISDVAIRQAQERAQGNPRLVFRVMDAEAMDFPDATFDLVCGTGILHHLHLENALRELRRVMKPTGSAIFIEPMGYNPLINLFRQRTPQYRTADEHPLKRADLRKMEAGFEEASFRFYHLLDIAAIPLRRRKKILPVLLRVLGGADRVLFTVIPPLRWWAWQVVIVLKNPLPGD